ncbi:hypothetical protein BSZ39_04420 [Bowdeniella nasicola]|uniref:Uncharacterized protein n=1 Tax=Bowdeniella nasicola TaxID=208480 RepID=A0A1Q5Q3K1_9ACTO|nr:hypothetical protein [Bowdeniella nasicola]OKL54403.1 hypothetical protein BSZ39_04420 [Bowdeniella nasicola]
MAKVWPTYNYTEHRLLLFVRGAGDDTSAFAIGVDGVKKIEPKDIQVPDVGGYSQLDYEGKPSIAMTIDAGELKKDNAAPHLYRVAMHELVHFYYQGDMAQDGGDSRAQAYPVDGTPRLYRRMIHHRLIEAYRHPDKRSEALAKAKYWLEKWQTEYADEAKSIKATDIAEGTARYTDNMAAFTTDSISKEDIRKKASELMVTGDFSASADAESYTIGEAAALLLDEVGGDWKKDFYQSNTTLADLLLKDVKTAEDSVDPEVKTKVDQAVKEQNDSIGKDIKDVTAAKKDTSIPNLKIDDTDTDGSYASSGSFLVDDEDVTTGFAKDYTVDWKNLTLSNLAVGHEFSEDGRSFLLVPLAMMHEVKDGRPHDQR